MDRLIALLGLRSRLEWRAVSRSPSRIVGLLLLAPGLLLFSGAGALIVFLGLRSLDRADPASLLPVVSVLATLVGVFWALSPVLAGVALAETHDLTRLMHLPIPLPTLVLSSLLCSLAQPVVLAELPILVAAALALAADAGSLVLALGGVALSFAFMLVAAQATGLMLLGVSRRRRWQDVGIFVGLGLGFLTSIAPVMLLSAGPARARALAHFVMDDDVFAVSPFAWGVRAAVHAGRGEGVPAALFAVAAAAALVGAEALSALLVGRVYRGELDLGEAASARAKAARMRLPGSVGALVEKDLRSAWRDPAVRASLMIGLVGPLLLVALLSRSGAVRSGRVVLGLATFLGASSFGANAFGAERGALALLFALPVARWRLLLGKNLAAMALRLPAIATLLVAAVWVAPLSYVPASLVIVAVLLLASAAVDNYASVLFPAPSAPPGREPYGRGRGRRGPGGAVLSLAALACVAVAGSPFVFLAWLPALLDRPGLWLGTLPLALAGAGAVYAMMLAGAAALLERREPELLERVLAES